MIGLGICADAKQAWLAIWLFDGENNDLTAGLALGDDWVSELDEEGYIYSRDKLARFANDGCGIPLDPLNRAARRALQEVGRLLGCQ